uniref:type II secretion system minor pseudopilin GspI n=1 Tax=Chitinimonas sp. TaxID=1934313 RepID=UPI0035B04F47
MKCVRGFTLIEVLVALVVLGVAMAAATRATLAVTDGSLALRRHLAGGWVAQNRINNYVIRGEFPALGTRDGQEKQAGMDFAWHETVSETPDRAFHRVEIKVGKPGEEH